MRKRIRRMPERSCGNRADATVSPEIPSSDTRRGAAQRRSAHRSLLTIHHLDVGYGEVQVLWDVSLEILAGEIVALVGANGAGKTTLLSTISGLLHPRAGTINFGGQLIGGSTTQRIVELGIAHVPEGRRLFPAMS